MENLIITKASEVTVKEVEWLWYPYIPYGKVTVLFHSHQLNHPNFLLED